MFLAHYSRGLSGHSWKSSAKLSNTLAWSSKAVVRTIHLSLSSSSPFWQYSLPLNLSPVQIFPLPSTACAWGTQKELMSELHPHSKTKWGVPTTGRNSPTFSIWEEKNLVKGQGGDEDLHSGDQLIPVKLPMCYPVMGDWAPQQGSQIRVYQ